MAELCFEQSGSDGSEGKCLSVLAHRLCSDRFDRGVAEGGKRVAHADVWKCARWVVQIVERDDKLGGERVSEVVDACCGLVLLVGGFEGFGDTSSSNLRGCGGFLQSSQCSDVCVGSEGATGRGGMDRVLLSIDAGQGVQSTGDFNAEGEASSSGGLLGGVENGKVKGKNWKKNLKARLRKARASSGSVSGDCSKSNSESGDRRSELASSFDDRRIAENRLATQKAEYQLKKNEYMTRSRVAEQQWETERLTCDQKLQKITEARFGTKPGFAETLVSANISSTSLPSMSQGTLSPDSSISVAEVNKMFRLIADLTAQVAQLTVESKAMKETAVLSAYEQRKLEMENMTFEQIAALRGTEKDIRPDGSPVKYDAIGQEIYSECGRPDFMNQYDYRSSITVSEDGQ